MSIPGFTAELSVLAKRDYRISATMLQQARTDADASHTLRPAVINYNCYNRFCCFWDDDLLLTCGYRQIP